MNKLAEQIKRQVVLPELRKLLSSIEGSVLELYDEHMVADVKIDNPFGPGTLTIERVPVQLGSWGFSQSGPFRGDRVVLSFKNMNPNTPVITGILDNHFKVNTEEQRFKHSRKGAYVPDGICRRTDWTYPSGLWD